MKGFINHESVICLRQRLLGRLLTALLRFLYCFVRAFGPLVCAPRVSRNVRAGIAESPFNLHPLDVSHTGYPCTNDFTHEAVRQIPHAWKQPPRAVRHCLTGFRLQNMVDGLGVTGYEGVFIRVCEITLSVLRSHRESLMSVLETFIHDPLVEWTKLHKSSTVEVENPQVGDRRKSVRRL